MNKNLQELRQISRKKSMTILLCKSRMFKSCFNCPLINQLGANFKNMLKNRKKKKMHMKMSLNLMMNLLLSLIQFKTMILLLKILISKKIIKIFDIFQVLF